MNTQNQSNIPAPVVEIPAIIIPDPKRTPINKYATYEHLASIIHLNYTTYFQECEARNTEYDPEIVIDSIENVLSRMIPELDIEVVESMADAIETLLYEGSSDQYPVRYHLEQLIATIIHTPANYTA
jgi:hypothetical protein